MLRCSHNAIALAVKLGTLSGCAASSPKATIAPAVTDPRDVLAPVGMVVREGGIIESAIYRGDC